MEHELHQRFAPYRLEGEWFLNVLPLAILAKAKDFKTRGDSDRVLAPLMEKAYEAGKMAGYADGELEASRSLRKHLDGWWTAQDETENRWLVDHAWQKVEALGGKTVTFESSAAEPKRELAANGHV